MREWLHLSNLLLKPFQSPSLPPSRFICWLETLSANCDIPFLLCLAIEMPSARALFSLVGLLTLYAAAALM